MGRNRGLAGALWAWRKLVRAQQRWLEIPASATDVFLEGGELRPLSLIEAELASLLDEVATSSRQSAAARAFYGLGEATATASELAGTYGVTTRTVSNWTSLGGSRPVPRMVPDPHEPIRVEAPPYWEMIRAAAVTGPGVAALCRAYNRAWARWRPGRTDGDVLATGLLSIEFLAGALFEDAAAEVGRSERKRARDMAAVAVLTSLDKVKTDTAHRRTGQQGEGSCLAVASDPLCLLWELADPTHQADVVETLVASGGPEAALGGQMARRYARDTRLPLALRARFQLAVVTCHRLANSAAGLGEALTARRIVATASQSHVDLTVNRTLLLTYAARRPDTALVTAKNGLASIPPDAARRYGPRAAAAARHQLLLVGLNAAYQKARAMSVPRDDPYGALAAIDEARRWADKAVTEIDNAAGSPYQVGGGSAQAEILLGLHRAIGQIQELKAGVAHRIGEPAVAHTALSQAAERLAPSSTQRAALSPPTLAQSLTAEADFAWQHPDVARRPLTAVVADLEAFAGRHRLHPGLDIPLIRYQALAERSASRDG
ncbi:hypothetical protein FRAHR75_210023 [Frankia sp. Hr75.2]|nr:hypothetical protein FRAHR75_210023 [Frankia sp. Hr75.2]